MYQAFIEVAFNRAACLSTWVTSVSPNIKVNPLKQIKAEQMTALPAPAVYTSVWGDE